ncbi:MAG: hypothetical protein ACRDV0_08010 [Acidimicrobiales bacterium]
MRAVVQRGPKGKRSVAFALDWPGWSRGAATPDAALAALASYRDRYRPVAELAGGARRLSPAGAIVVVEDAVGTGSTDFWGISFAPSSLEGDPMPVAAFERHVALLRACWSYFDDVAARVSPEMRRGPRGGGRDRDEIIAHTRRVESQDFAKRLGLRVPEGTALATRGLGSYRDAYVAAMGAYRNGEVRPMRSWTLAFLIRHSAFHVMDHAWEMEDKDLSRDSV